MDPQELAQEIDAALVGHLEVGEHDVEGAVARLLQGLAGVAGGGDLVALALQDRLQDVALVALVVDDEDPWLHARTTSTGLAFSPATSGSRGMDTRAVVPRSGALSSVIEPPWSATILWVRARPRPSPVSFVEK